MQTLVKLMLRLTTKVTVSPTCRRRISSAARVRACRSRPVTCARVMPSSTVTSPPSRAWSRMRRTAGDAQSRLPVTPVFMTLLHDAVGVDQRGHARPQGFGEELRARGELGIDGQPLPEDEALSLGGAPQLGDEGPGLLGIDVVEGEG